MVFNWIFRLNWDVFVSKQRLSSKNTHLLQQTKIYPAKLAFCRNSRELSCKKGIPKAHKPDGLRMVSVIGALKLDCKQG